MLGGGAPSAGPLQGRGFAAGGGPEDVAPAIKALKLSEQQKGEVEAIWQAHQEKGRELLQKRERGEIDFAALRSAHDKLNEELLQQMKSVLNEEQYKKLKQAIARSEP